MSCPDESADVVVISVVTSVWFVRFAGFKHNAWDNVYQNVYQICILRLVKALLLHRHKLKYSFRIIITPTRWCIWTAVM